MAIDTEWLDARIAKTKTMIETYEDAILALETDPDRYAKYTIETAQTRETVEKSDLDRMRRTVTSLENRLATLCARRNGGGTYSRPGF